MKINMHVIDELTSLGTLMNELFINYDSDTDVAKPWREKVIETHNEHLYEAEFKLASRLGLSWQDIDINTLWRKLSMSLFRMLIDILEGKNLYNPSEIKQSLLAIQLIVNNVDNTKGVLDKNAISKIKEKIENILPVVDEEEKKNTSNNFKSGTKKNHNRRTKKLDGSTDNQ